MTIKDCETRVESVKRRFGEYFKQEFDVDVFLLGRAGVGGKREEVFRLCSEPLFDFLPTTSGETLYGPTGTAVLMYPFNCKYPAEFDFALCHEFGHVFFCRDNEELYFKLNNLKSIWGEGGMARLGLKLWSEFIAHSIANQVMDYEPAQIAFAKQDELIRYLYNALPGLNMSTTPEAQKQWELLCEGGIVIPYALGLYCAMYLTDPTIMCLMHYEPDAATGLEKCTEGVARGIVDILSMLDDKLDEEQFWIVDEQWLERLGLLVMRLRDTRISEM